MPFTPFTNLQVYTFLLCLTALVILGLVKAIIYIIKCYKEDKKILKPFQFGERIKSRK